MKPAAFVLLIIICLLLAAWCIIMAAAHFGGSVTRFGGSAAAARPRRGPDYTKSAHIVVDTLNLTHWLNPGAAMSPKLIAETVDRTAPELVRRHSGRVMYVLKDRESQFNDEAAREVYRQAADRNKVYVYVAEKYVDPPKGVSHSDEHSARGRDDFFVSLLAHRWRCAVLTEDRLRDFDQFRKTIQPFHVYEFAFWRTAPLREFVRPEASAYVRMKKPRMVRYADYFPNLQQ